MELQTITIKESDEDFYNYLFDLEEQWQKSLPRLTDKELLKTFPEAKGIIPEKIQEWEEKREENVKTIRDKLTLVKSRVADEFSRWFWREWVKVNEGEELLKIDNHISRLKRLFSVAKGRVIKGRLTEEEIQRALTVPLETIFNQPLRKSGGALVGLCPLHEEKTPSFFVYPDSNSFYCYGCNQGGNVINFVRLLYGSSFKEAVQYLVGGE